MQDTEFSAYESDAKTVEQLADHDTGAKGQGAHAKLHIRML